MKIVFFRHSLLSRGGDKMVLAHAAHLADEGYHVAIRANIVSTVFPVNPRINVEPLAFKGKLGTLLSSLVEKQDADVVIADIIPLVTLLKLSNLRKIIYFAQDYDESYYTNFLQKLLIRILYFVGLSLFKIPVIAVSHNLADTLRRRFKADAQVALNGVDTKVFYHDPSPELIAEKGKRKAILLLSRKDRRKGFDLATVVISQLKERLGDAFEVWTVGEKVRNFSENIIHRDFGYVDEEHLRNIFSSADLFLYPTRHEGLPLMPLEAYACRCPVVTTVAVPYAENFNNAMVSEIEDVSSLLLQVCKLLEDKKLREIITENAHEYALEHSLHVSQKRFENILLALAR